MLTQYAAQVFYTLAVALLEYVLGPAALMIAIGIFLYKKKVIINWRRGGLEKELKLAKCGTLIAGAACGRSITRCEHDLGAREGTWEHYDDSTHYHYDKDGKPTEAVTHK